MAYRVDYQPIKKLRGLEKTRLRIPILTVLWLIIFLCFVHMLCPNGIAFIQSAIVSESIKTSFEEFVCNLEAGQSISEAAEAFSGAFFNAAD